MQTHSLKRMNAQRAVEYALREIDCAEGHRTKLDRILEDAEAALSSVIERESAQGVADVSRATRDAIVESLGIKCWCSDCDKEYPLTEARWQAAQPCSCGNHGYLLYNLIILPKIKPPRSPRARWECTSCALWGIERDVGISHSVDTRHCVLFHPEP